MYLLVMVLCMMFVMTSCGRQEAPPAALPPAPEGTPFASYDADRFKSVEELSNQVLARIGDPGGDINNLGSLSFYFEPEVPPENMILDEIAVKGFYCVLSYLVDGANANDYDNRFDFEWYRTLKEADLPQSLESHCGVGNTYETYTDGDVTYFIQKVSNPVFSSDGTLVEKQYEDVCYTVFWTQHGYVFHVNAALSFSYEEIARYCKARIVFI